MDNLRFYDSAITQQEIMDLFAYENLNFQCEDNFVPLTTNTLSTQNTKHNTVLVNQSTCPELQRRQRPKLSTMMMIMITIANKMTHNSNINNNYHRINPISNENALIITPAHSTTCPLDCTGPNEPKTSFTRSLTHRISA
jgi:hypothetical protein